MASVVSLLYYGGVYIKSHWMAKFKFYFRIDLKFGLVQTMNQNPKFN